MHDKTKAAVLGSFLGDSLALGAHWIYDQGLIAERFGRVDTLLAPAADSYHSTKKAGGFTHYGDQTLVLLESLAARKTFDLEDFGTRWLGLFRNDYRGYVDSATRQTLGTTEFGGPGEWGSGSNDLSGAARLAPLAAVYANDPEGFAAAARAQAKMTHNNAEVLDAAAFYARTLAAVLNGTPPVAAMEQAAGKPYAKPLKDWLETGLSMAHMPATQAVAALGQSCHAPDAFPAVAALVAKYEADPVEALVQNAMAGGDSAARGMILGALLFAHAGTAALPAAWLETLAARKKIEELLAAF